MGASRDRRRTCRGIPIRMFCVLVSAGPPAGPAATGRTSARVAGTVAADESRRTGPLTTAAMAGAGSILAPEMEADRAAASLGGDDVAVAHMPLRGRPCGS
jgi:hypothetical protein